MIGAVGVFALVRAYPPTQYGWMPSCMFHQITGWHCPDCGGTRVVTALVHGDLGLAVRSNALLVIGLLVILIGVRWQRFRASRGLSNSPVMAWAIVVVVVGFFFRSQRAFARDESDGAAGGEIDITVIAR